MESESPENYTKYLDNLKKNKDFMIKVNKRV